MTVDECRLGKVTCDETETVGEMLPKLGVKETRHVFSVMPQLVGQKLALNRPCEGAIVGVFNGVSRKPQLTSAFARRSVMITALRRCPALRPLQDMLFES